MLKRLTKLKIVSSILVMTIMLTGCLTDGKTEVETKNSSFFSSVDGYVNLCNMDRQIWTEADEAMMSPDLAASLRIYEEAHDRCE
jgi:PBP1b-binding outer membrane lipoprotein LpoB